MRSSLRRDPAIAPLIQERYWGPWPSPAELLGADLLHRCLEGPAASEVDVGQATAYGLELGRVSSPLLAQRWEEGWDRPLAEWREQLGITALVKRSPFRSETARG